MSKKVTLWHEAPEFLEPLAAHKDLKIQFQKIPDQRLAHRTCTTYVIPDFCSDCIFCQDSCPNLKFDKENKIMRVNQIACKGCGVCLPACPTGALQQRNSHLGQIERDILTMLNQDDTGVPLTCNQCPIVSADVRPPGNGTPHIRVMCTGRFEPAVALDTLAKGYEAVLVVGCLFKGFPFERNRFALADRLEFSGKIMHLLGIDPGKVASVPAYIDEGGVAECLRKLVEA